MSNVSANETFNPDGHPSLSPIYSHISRVALSPTATLVSLAGQVGVDPATNTIPNTLGEQVKVALANVDRCLAAAGAQKKDIVQVRQYVVNLLPQDPVRAELYAEWMGGLTPPSTKVGVQSLGHRDYLFEIEVICVVVAGAAAEH